MKLDVKITDIFDEKVTQIKNIDTLIKFLEKEAGNHRSSDIDNHIFQRKISKLNYFNLLNEENIKNFKKFIDYVDNKYLDIYEKVKIISTYGSMIESLDTKKELTYDISKITEEEMYFLTNITKMVSYDDYLLYQYIFLNPIVRKFIFSFNKDIEQLIKDYFNFKFRDNMSMNELLKGHSMEIDEYTKKQYFHEVTKEVLSRYKEYYAVKEKGQDDLSMGM